MERNEEEGRSLKGRASRREKEVEKEREAYRLSLWSFTETTDKTGPPPK